MKDIFIHPQAIVDATEIGAGTRIWAFAHVMRDAVLGRSCNVGEHCFVESGASVGDNVTLKNGVSVWDGVTLADDVFVGPQAMFTNDLFPRSPRAPVARPRYEEKKSWLVPTFVQQGASIGAGAVIMAGCTVGAWAMVAAGAVVTRDVKPHALVVGSPAKYVGFVCRCGQRLAADEANWQCAGCGLEFRSEEDRISEK